MFSFLRIRYSSSPEASRTKGLWPGTAGVLGVQTCTSDRRSDPVPGNKKEPSRFCPLSARCGAWPLKKLHSDYEAGVSPQTAKPQPRACSLSMWVSRRIEEFLLCKTSGGQNAFRFRRRVSMCGWRVRIENSRAAAGTGRAFTTLSETARASFKAPVTFPAASARIIALYLWGGRGKSTVKCVFSWLGSGTHFFVNRKQTPSKSPLAPTCVENRSHKQKTNSLPFVP
jgi:hypothetical protein